MHIQIFNYLKNISLLRGLYIVYKLYFKDNKKKMGFCANNVNIVPPIDIGYPENVYLYEGVRIRGNSIISTPKAKFIMKKNSGAAEGLNVRTGNHQFVVGVWYKDVTNDMKDPEMDRDVIVDEDVWIASNVTLLNGVHIGRGCTIGAGAVVTKSMPPYTVVAGVPAKVIKLKYSKEQIIEHERKLYPESERLNMDLINSICNQYHK